MTQTPTPTKPQLICSARYYWSRPQELADRLASEWERWREKPTAAPAGLGTEGTATEVVHRLLGVTGECAICAPFDQVWDSITARFPERHHHDSGLGTMTAVWAATRHLRPERAVETGVARGFTSAVILSAMQANGAGHLWSIDLPEVNLIRSGGAGAAVDPGLADRWTWLKGGSRRLLPDLLERNTPVDLFVHDSLHTRANMLFEMRLAWAALRPGGLLLVDDVDHNSAFAEFTAGIDAPHGSGVQGNRPGVFGAALKPAPAGSEAAPH